MLAEFRRSPGLSAHLPRPGSDFVCVLLCRVRPVSTGILPDRLITRLISALITTKRQTAWKSARDLIRDSREAVLWLFSVKPGRSATDVVRTVRNPGDYASISCGHHHIPDVQSLCCNRISPKVTDTTVLVGLAIATGPCDRFFVLDSQPAS